MVGLAQDRAAHLNKLLSIDPIADSLQPATGYNPMPPQHMSCSDCCRPLVGMATREQWDALCHECARGEG